MYCPKCKVKIGIIKHESIFDSGFVQGSLCIMCGYWSQPIYPLVRKEQNNSIKARN